MTSPSERPANDITVEELERIRAAHGGILSPLLVVQDARSTNSLFHHRFQWDNDVAGELHRIDQARSLIESVFMELT